MSTPEYQKEYDAAMAKLEADAGGKSADKPAESNTSQVQAGADKDAPSADAKPDVAAELEKLRKDQESTAKALKDTKAVFTRSSQELANLKREREAEKHAATRPPILDANPGLEEAVKHVVAAARPEPDPMARVAGVIERALPDLEEMLNNSAFKAKVDAARPSDGAWADPLIAIRDLSAIRAEHIRDTAVASARADFEKKSGKLAAMEVAGGSGGGSGAAKSEKVDEAKKVWDMSKADFDKSRAKTLGYAT